MKKSSEIRQEFLDFFASKGHIIVPSAPVIPYDDPTLLFTNAGMNQFKDVFLGTGTRNFTRAVDSQKCIRVSGKHNDLEEVGHDAYHHTFFEMLGNWSFGDYYKKDAIVWAWELLTEKWNLSKERLWATVFKTDDESYNLWKSGTDISKSHILRFGEKDNFWEMGETGPCGPCSEIHIDLTENGCNAKDINAGIEGVIELWNLVFIQYNRDRNGNLHDLPKKHIDTGMGFERVVRVLQGKNSNYETDIFLPLINELINISGLEYSGKYIPPMNVISDHIRTLTFAIADGAIPSNEGRGYVLRRILRRAARYGRKLDMHQPFIYRLPDVLVETMGSFYPGIKEKQGFIKEVIQSEEESFNITLDRGLKLFNEAAQNLMASGKKIFPGTDAFKLYDTYGFPLDLTQVLASETGLSVDISGYDSEMEAQKKRARDARKIDTTEAEINTTGDWKINYDPYHIHPDGIQTEILDTAENKVVIKDNPFYSESGGQVSDTGRIILNDGKELNVIYSRKDYVIISDKDIPLLRKRGRGVAIVDFPRRLSIERNHSATHLVHEALKRVLGSHVKQMGSYLDDHILRFDFPHFHKLSALEIIDIESIVNAKINEGVKVYSEIMPLDKASKIPNVKMFFGEKYGDEVRVVFIDENFSVELCGGTHVDVTEDIGLFKIIKEESISSGVRRIFAKTGIGIVSYLDEKITELENIADNLTKKYSNDIRKTLTDYRQKLHRSDHKDIQFLSSLFEYQNETTQFLSELREKMIEEKKIAEKEISKKHLSKALDEIDSLIKNAESVNGYKIFKAQFSDANMDELKEIADNIRNKINSGAALIYSSSEGKINLVTLLTDDLVKKGLNAGNIAKEVSKIVGGGGGGKPHLATAGGKDISKLDEAVSKFTSIFKNHLGKI